MCGSSGSEAAGRNEDGRPNRSGTPLTTAKSVLAEHRWFVAVLLLYVAGAWVATRFVGSPADLRVTLYFSESSAVGTVTAAIAIGFLYVGHLLLVRRPRAPLAHLRQDLEKQFLSPERLWAGALVVVLLPAFVSTFSSLKAMISLVHPFEYDPLFARLDETLHFGVAPWRLLHPIVGHPRVTSAVSLIYSAWFFVVYGSLLWYAFSRKDPRLRMRFLLSFVGTWILLGTVLAILLSSAGPCYYGRVTGLADPFEPLMAYLHRVDQSYPVWALTAQQRLWDLHESSQLGVGAGISAMPSLHVAIAFLIFLAARRTHRVAGAVAGLYATMVMIGSVHLGWHYAVDGYVGIAGAAVVWRLVGRMLDHDSEFADVPAPGSG